MFPWRASKQDHERDAQLPASISAQRKATDTAKVEEDDAAAQRALQTPHDAILAQLQGRTSRRPSKELKKEEEDHSEDALRMERQRSSSSAMRSMDDDQPPLEVLYDPFTGVPLGELLPDGATGQNTEGGSDEDLWTHLARVLELQSEIASMHVKMEGIGTKTAEGARNRPTGLTTNQQQSSSTTGTHRQRHGRRGFGDEQEDSMRMDDDVDADVGVDGVDEEERRRNHKREEEISRLADKFVGRKEAIDGIMSKLDDLSKEVTLFHSLITPVIDFSTSRNNSTNAEPSNQSQNPNMKKATPQSTGSGPYPQPGAQVLDLNPPLPAPAAISTPAQRRPDRLIVETLHGQGNTQSVVESPVSLDESHRPPTH